MDSFLAEFLISNSVRWGRLRCIVVQRQHPVRAFPVARLRGDMPGVRLEESSQACRGLALYSAHNLRAENCVSVPRGSNVRACLRACTGRGPSPVPVPLRCQRH